MPFLDLLMPRKIYTKMASSHVGHVAQLFGASLQKAAGLIPSESAYRRKPIDVCLSHRCLSLSFLLSLKSINIFSGEDFFLKAISHDTWNGSREATCQTNMRHEEGYKILFVSLPGGHGILKISIFHHDNKVLNYDKYLLNV